LEPGSASPRFAGMLLLVFPFGFDSEPKNFFAFIQYNIGKNYVWTQASNWLPKIK
jgi:hypothetical protein